MLSAENYTQSAERLKYYSISPLLYEATIPFVSFPHYENSPIQIYRKFHLQKLKIFRWKTLIFFIFLLKTWIVGTR